MSLASMTKGCEPALGSSVISDLIVGGVATRTGPRPAEHRCPATASRFPRSPNDGMNAGYPVTS
ncbi:MAG: hypothetical protein CMJ23_09750 [Phycisphaerae bacterium]|nr:hypothetical protein [Phycisphaerae bacterium]